MLNYFAIFPLFNVALCIGLSLFIFFRNPRHPANIGFALGLINLAFIEAGNAIFIFSDTQQQSSPLGMQSAMIGQAFLPAVWLLFSLTFARSNYKEILIRWSPFIVCLGLVSTFFAFWTSSPKFLSFSSSITGNIKPVIASGQTSQFIVGPIGRYFYIYLILGLMFNLIHLENTLRSSKGVKRWQIKYIIFGVGSILVFFIYLSSQALLFSTLEIQLFLSLSAVILISVSMMAFFIIRHRLLDVDIFISRYVVYNSLTVLIVGLYLLSAGLLAKGIRYFNIPFADFFNTILIFTTALAFFIFLFITTLRRKVQLFINRHFFKHKYEFRDKWMETIDLICSKSSIEETYKTLIEMISETMGVKKVYLWLYHPKPNHFRMVQNGLGINQKIVEITHPLIQRIKTENSPFVLNDLKRPRLQQSKEEKEQEDLFSSTGTVLCAPLIAGGDIIGFILQGDDMSGETYRQDDFELLKAMTTQAAVQINKLKLARDLMAAKEVEGFHRLSSFMMHDLKNLTNSLSLISQNAKENINNPEFQQDAIETIEETAAKMNKLIRRLSYVPKVLKLAKEKVDLKEIVHNALKRLRLNEEKKVIVTNETQGVPLINVDRDAMEMVFLNLITNAYDAIEREGKIEITASLKGQFVNVIISDNGVGMSREFIEKSLFQPFNTTKTEGFGIGLFQCKTVIEEHGGKIEVNSEKGKGAIFKLKLPRD